ncbi:DUF5667 domain-containing protein [Streptomyces sp. NBC_00963]|uniref:DUF5667 domain-containing protein n=1 Tax=Streptomyces sp. NBC_00963 TaxID=2903697 RepID=UPI00386F6F69|nr:DUF5667 domain-containing protein [Streptomyces sp. NBC_00963]
MIGQVSAHRRANAFAQALEEQTLQGSAADQPEAPTDPSAQGQLLALVTGLEELPKPQLDPEVKVVQRAQLVAAMETMLAGGGVSEGPQVPEQRTGRGAHRASPLRKLRPRSRWSKGLAAGGLTVGVAAGAFSGVAAASSDALPGDSLYGLKRGMEDLKLGMANDDAARGQIYLDQASTRLQEARRLMERDRAGRLDHEQLGEVRRALNGMNHDAGEGHRLLHEAYARNGALGPIQTLSSFSRSHREAWSKLRGRLPVQLHDVGNQVNSVFDAIDQEVGPLQSQLPRTPGTPAARTPGHPGTSRPGTPGTDRSGPSSAAPGHHSQSNARPEPSGSESGKADQGLIGGSTGGLLDPPKSSSGSSSSEGTGKSGDGTKPAPDVTLPPLLPGLLPGLGIDGEDAQ